MNSLIRSRPDRLHDQGIRSKSFLLPLFAALCSPNLLVAAQRYLANTAMPAAEISFLLGYDEPNSFFRAFKGWTGRTPDSVRQLA